MTDSVARSGTGGGPSRTPDPGEVADDRLISAAERTAAELMFAAAGYETAADRRRRRRVGTLVGDPASRDLLLDLTDQVLRFGSRRRAARRLRDLVAERGIPAVATGPDRLALLVGAWLAPRVPGLVIPAVSARLRHELSAVVLPAAPRALARHARRRARRHIRLNVNLLGEAVLGDGEASRRTELVAGLLARPDVSYVSVKISSICAQLEVLAYEDSLRRITDRLRSLYEVAASCDPPRFLNLDMEEYRDLELTVDAFTTVLAEPALRHLDAGIVLQAYLPDSIAALERIAAFARQRYADSGGRVKVRLVKGANLAMERVEAEQRGWPQAPFASKAEVDANLKRLLELALKAENDGALRVGVASHNLFDIGWALAVRAEVEPERVELEMLEGMANPQALALAAMAGRLLLYAPVVRRDDFASAVAYLVRRFDENTAPENFLARLFELSPGAPSWEVERARFESAVAARRLPAGGPRRRQDRAAEEQAAEEQAAEVRAVEERAVGGGAPAEPFANEPDTDFSLSSNRLWLARHLGEWRSHVVDVPALVDGEQVGEPMSGRSADPSAPGSVLYRYVEANLETVERAVAVAVRAAERWRRLSAAERRQPLEAVARALAGRRGQLLAVMAHDAGKVVGEADPEVSEAIDLARYYGRAAQALDGPPGDRHFDPYGVVVVAPPWNFPLAIPAGGVLASLAAGSAVILKPAPETVLTAWHLARCCWDAGVPGDVLQLVPTADDDVGRRLVTHPKVDAVVLTGSFETARLFLGWKPELALHAETSGKNAAVVTAAADQDDAIRDLLRSAFSHAGQKCSAASLAILEAPVYDDARFLARLADAAASLRVGPAADPATQVGPLVRPPTGALGRALSLLGPGERWLLRPHQIGDNPQLWSPGIKTGVRPGSEFHLTECFGPVLGVMRAADLAEAVELQNAPRYGLTGGIHTLDDAEVRYWLERVAVGNAYVNRHVTGAIVQRQPFGGWKRSSVGPGAKAGGPSYVASLGRWSAAGDRDPDPDADGTAATGAQLVAARSSFAHWSAGEDASALASERNTLRLVALGSVGLRLGAPVDVAALALALAIAADLGVHLEVSAAAALPGLPDGTRIEPDASYLARAPGTGADRVRLVASPGELRLALIDAGLDVDVEPLSRLGEVELQRWTREQAVSETLHRHGNVRRRGEQGSVPIAGLDRTSPSAAASSRG